jgi:serine/threonine protein kinase/tetratricopeptide (TPR) repeat protein
VDLDAFAARHPEQADALRELFPALEMLAHLSGSASPDAGRNALATQEPSPKIGTLGDFRIVREVGRGGMGVVYEAVQISMGRRVALKVLPFAAVMDPRHLQRFKNEARAAGSLQHPHIVPVHFVGSERGVHYFAMQFVEGQTLAALIQQLRQSAVPDEKTTTHPQPDGAGQPDAATEPAARHSTLAASVSPKSRDYFRKVAEWGEQAAEALDHAHQTGIVHRDVKPANLMIDGRGHLWVTDFGLAHVQQGEASLTMTGDLIGTLRYMSPEQALAQRVLIDHRTDVYSLGVTLYELLTLEPAFAGTDRQEVLRQIAFEEPKPPGRRNRAVPAELETIVLKALEKNPADRFATAKDLAEDLRRFLEDKPIHARRPNWKQRAVKWARRHHDVVRTASAAVVLAMLGAAIAVVMLAAAYQQETAHRLAAEQAQKNEEQERKKAQKATADERKAKEVADERRRQAEAVADLLESVFTRLDPYAETKDGLDLKEQLLAELDQAADKLERESADPLTQARLQNALAMAFLGLGQANKAISHVQRSLEKRLAKLGPDHPDTLTSMNDLALAYLADDQLKKAMPLLEQTLENCRDKLIPYHPLTLTCMNNLGRAYLADRQLQRALPLLEQTLEKRRDKLGPDHPDTLTTLNNLAIVYVTAGQPQKALPLLDAIHKTHQVQLGPDNPRTLDSMNNLAGAYKDVGQLEKAIPLFQKTLAKRKDTLRADHPLVLLAMNNLAGAYWSDKQLDRSVPLFEETLRMRKEKQGPDHPQTLLAMANLAVNYRDAGRVAEAIPLLEEALDRARKRPDGLPADLAWIHTALAATQAQLGLNLLRQKKYTEAEPLLRDCLRIREQKEPTAWTTFNTRSMLGGSLLGQQKYKQAEPLLLAGYKGMKESATPIPAAAKIRLVEAVQRLVQLYEVWDRPEDAARWRKELQTLHDKGSSQPPAPKQP